MEREIEVILQCLNENEIKKSDEKDEVKYYDNEDEIRYGDDEDGIRCSDNEDAVRRNDEDVDSQNDEDVCPTNPFPWYCPVFILLSTVFYVFDLGSDLLLAYRYLVEEEIQYFGLTVMITLAPNLIMSYFSLKWYLEDDKRKKASRLLQGDKIENGSRWRWVLRAVMLILQLGPVLRYLDTFYYGILCRRAKDLKEKKRYYYKVKYEEADAGLLSLFEAFTEAAPQLLLQLYILNHPDTIEDSYTVISRKVSCASSFLSICWTLTSQQRTMRNAQSNSKNLSWPASITLYLWVAFVTGSRILTLGLFVSLFPYILATVCFFRWMVWLIWLKRKKTTVFDDQFDTVLYKCALCVVFLFVYINPSPEPTRWRYVLYYLYTLTEDSVLIAIWYIWSDPLLWYKQLAIIGVFVFFFIGLAFMAVYYLVLHPTVSVKYQTEKSLLDGFAEYSRRNVYECFPNSVDGERNGVAEDTLKVQHVIMNQRETAV